MWDGEIFRKLGDIRQNGKNCCPCSHPKSCNSSTCFSLAGAGPSNICELSAKQFSASKAMRVSQNDGSLLLGCYATVAKQYARQFFQQHTRYEDLNLEKHACHVGTPQNWTHTRAVHSNCSSSLGTGKHPAMTATSYIRSFFERLKLSQKVETKRF